MALVRAEAMFGIFPAKVVREQKVKLRPNEHYYEGKNGEPCTTYSCQICEQLFDRISGFHFGEDDENGGFIKFVVLSELWIFISAGKI